jgi:hypothetical protein
MVFKRAADTGVARQHAARLIRVAACDISRRFDDNTRRLAEASRAAHNPDGAACGELLECPGAKGQHRTGSPPPVVPNNWMVWSHVARYLHDRATQSRARCVEVYRNLGVLSGHRFWRSPAGPRVRKSRGFPRRPNGLASSLGSVLTPQPIFCESWCCARLGSACSKADPVVEIPRPAH